MHLFGFAPTGIPAWDTILRQLEQRARREPPPKPRGAQKLAILKALLQHLKHDPLAHNEPRHSTQMVHVAGTVGKGLTAMMITKLLGHVSHLASSVHTKGGVGLFTSPHLVRLEERIQYNGQPMPPAILAQAGQAVFAAEARLEPVSSFFDIMTLIAWMAFGLKQARWAVMETGMGGTADATNAIEEKCCAVITRIGLDHQAQLGKGLQNIAREKLGITRPRTPLVLAVQPPALERWMQAKAKQQGVSDVHHVRLSPIKAYRRGAQRGVVLADRQRIALPSSIPNGTRLPDEAECHLTNVRLQCLANAVLTVKVCLGHTYPQPIQHSKRPATQLVHTKAWQQGLAQALQTPWNGRLHILQQQATPKGILLWLLLDGAHNPPAIKALCTQLRRWKIPRMQLVFAMHTDKLTAAMAAPLLSLFGLASQVILPQQSAPRFAKPAHIQNFILKACQRNMPPPLLPPLLLAENAPEALQKAAQTPQMPLVVAGSLWLAGEVFEQLQHWQHAFKKPVGLGNRH